MGEHFISASTMDVLEPPCKLDKHQATIRLACIKSHHGCRNWDQVGSVFFWHPLQARVPSLYIAMFWDEHLPDRLPPDLQGLELWFAT